ncbi:MAG: hypothetical protein IJM64_03615 [Ottowia sp.]|nr:hypothetical protein [Ottowia sp.]
MKHRTTRAAALLAALALCSASALAQQELRPSPEQEYIFQVRAVYAKAQDAIKQGQGEPQAKNEATLQATYMRPGAGQTQHKVELFFRMVPTEEPGHVRRQLYLARETFNVAARTFYREYLYDDAGAPLFFYTRHDSFDKGRVEQRYYYRSGKLVVAEPEGGDGATHLPQFERMKALLQSTLALQQGDE